MKHNFETIIIKRLLQTSEMLLHENLFYTVYRIDVFKSKFILNMLLLIALQYHTKNIVLTLQVLARYADEPF